MCGPRSFYDLAEDEAPEVRQEIAANSETPSQGNLLLANDRDSEVRCTLADKVSRLVPGLSSDGHERLRKQTTEVLEIRARDQLPRVRQILSESLRDVTYAPPTVIRCLAADEEIDVAGPVLRYSPLLSDTDLLEIVRTTGAAGALGKISERAGLSAIVADAIVAADDAKAITMLLANNSAQIREETLDELINQAPRNPDWHGPLVRRPKLSTKAIRRIAGFVADSMLDVLKSREDMDSETLEAVASEMHRRLESENQEISESAQEDDDKADQIDTPDQEMAHARQLHEAGELDEEIINTAMDEGRRDFATAALAVRAEFPYERADKMVSSQNPKGIVALAWRAGLSVEGAVRLQMQLGRIPPNSRLFPRHGADYPLSEDDMNWQIELFAAMVPGAEINLSG